MSAWSLSSPFFLPITLSFQLPSIFRQSQGSETVDDTRAQRRKSVGRNERKSIGDRRSLAGLGENALLGAEIRSSASLHEKLDSSAPPAAQLADLIRFAHEKALKAELSRSDQSVKDQEGFQEQANAVLVEFLHEVGSSGALDEACQSFEGFKYAESLLYNGDPLIILDFLHVKTQSSK
eukprot:m.347738 g.347738  ORF g.347738 m.347738 type:complete len:179 (-) comp55858_c0_seq2:753-1289(-)